MTKVLKTIPLLCLLATAVAGCIDEDRAGCLTEQPVRLVFRYTAEGDENVVDRYISSAHVSVFDGEGKLVDVLNAGKEELLSEQGVLLPIKEPGQYSVVCWGNAADNTEITMGGTLETSTVQHPNYTRGMPVPTHDPLYYSLTPITVSGTGEQQDNARFICAYIGMDIYIKPSVAMTRAAVPPVVEVHNLTPRYDFGMNPLDAFSATSHPTVEMDEERGMYAAHLNVLRFTDEENPTEIEIKDSPGGESICRLKLKEFMQEQTPPISVAGEKEVRIPVLIDYSGLEVTVTLPAWTGEEITPV